MPRVTVGPAGPSGPRRCAVSPTGLVATAGNGSATVTFQPPAIDSATVLQYTITAAPGGATCITALTSCTVNGLTNGQTYTFTGTSDGRYGTSVRRPPPPR